MLPRSEENREKSCSVKKNIDEKDESQSEGEEIDVESFDELFPKLMEMRSKAAFLDHKGRQKLAEKVRSLSHEFLPSIIYRPMFWDGYLC